MVKLPVSEARAMRPPVSPPMPMPRFIVTRCSAKALCARGAGVSLVSSTDCAGQ